MPLIRFILNDKLISTDLPPGMVVLDFIRYHQLLMGTKIGCREGDCGACTVLVGSLEEGKLNYQSMTSCLLPLANVQGRHIVTVEGINFPGKLNPIQEAMSAAGATQCGFCTPGFIMSLAGYCLQSENTPVLAAVDGNICRCTGYKSIERAASVIESKINERKQEDAISFVTRNEILPAYFSSIKERLKTIQDEIPGQNDTPSILAGGTDLYVQKHEEMVHDGHRFVFNEHQLKGISKDGDFIKVGASVTVSDLRNSSLFNELIPQFHQYSKLISSTPIRNMATLAGNFVNASPIGDMTIFFLALDARLVLDHNGSVRELPLRKLYKGYKQLDKLPGELVLAIRFPVPAKNSLFHFEKVSKRTHLDIASVNTAIQLTTEKSTISSALLSAGGVGPVPLFLEKTAAFLQGKEVSESLIREAIEIMKTEISPISDARGTKEYKTLLLSQLIKAHFLKLFPSVIGEHIIETVS